MIRLRGDNDKGHTGKQARETHTRARAWEVAMGTLIGYSIAVNVPTATFNP